MSKVTLKQIRDSLKEGTTIFFVHAGWCPYTVQFYPIFDKVLNNLKTKNMDKYFNVIKLDDVMTRSIRANYKDIYSKLADYDSDVDEYKLFFPTVVMFVNGKRYKYQVDVRTVQNFEAFILSKLPKLSRRTGKVVKGGDENKTTINNERELINKQRVKSVQVKRSSNRPVKLLRLQEQIDKAFKKLLM